MDVYLVRHGESIFNVDPSNDSIDCPLSNRGIDQSKNLTTISPIDFSLVICSPLRRCRDTLALSSIRYDRMEVCSLVREIRAGCRSDLLHDEEYLQSESDEQVHERIEQINAYLERKKSENEKNVLIVTHADLVWHLTGHKIDGEYFGTWLDNAEMMHWKQI